MRELPRAQATWYVRLLALGRSGRDAVAQRPSMELLGQVLQSSGCSAPWLQPAAQQASHRTLLFAPCCSCESLRIQKVGCGLSAAMANGGVPSCIA
jgi:hypothetical protein